MAAAIDIGTHSVGVSPEKNNIRSYIKICVEY